ncbi:hypothetical protein R1flu_027094 [Riccia fluitans]|uniref:Bet v I/Major latex protein domain-containing protein n=1 Tax=Riccia fluitans TaxID=41844 RepID=A0ABD1XKS4_9MARC
MKSKRLDSHTPDIPRRDATHKTREDSQAQDPLLIRFRSHLTSCKNKMAFEHEVELDVSAAAIWLAFKDQNTILPKLLPEAIASIEVVEGEGAPGTTRLIKFGSVSPDGGYVKEKLISIDLESRIVVTEEVEGGHLVQFGFTKWVQTLKLISTGENTSKVHVTAEFEGGSEENIAKSNEVTKHGLTGTFKALEQYVKSSS